jgi:hypothetical protein
VYHPPNLSSNGSTYTTGQSRWDASGVPARVGASVAVEADVRDGVPAAVGFAVGVRKGMLLQAREERKTAAIATGNAKRRGKRMARGIGMVLLEADACR